MILDASLLKLSGRYYESVTKNETAGALIGQANHVHETHYFIFQAGLIHVVATEATFTETPVP